MRVDACFLFPGNCGTLVPLNPFNLSLNNSLTSNGPWKNDIIKTPKIIYLDISFHFVLGIFHHQEFCFSFCPAVSLHLALCLSYRVLLSLAEEDWHKIPLPHQDLSMNLKDIVEYWDFFILTRWLLFPFTLSWVSCEFSLLE